MSVELNQLELDYSCSQWSNSGKTPEEVIEQFIRVEAKCHEANLLTYPHELNVSYGNGEHEFLDIWANLATMLGESKSESVHTAFVYFHGGYWQEGDRTQGATLVPALLSDSGDERVENPRNPALIFATVGYDYASAVRSICWIVERQVMKAIDYIARRFPHASLVLCGHSAGAHLATKAIESMEDSMLKRVKALVCLAGVYDLSELVHTYIGRAIGLSNEDAVKASVDYSELAIRMRGKHILLLLSENDAPKIGEQNRRLIAAIGGEKALQVPSGVEVEMKSIAEADHFTLVERFEDQTYEQSQALSKLIAVIEHG